jgi:phospholipid/cholesterol/gamma-HCH transport system substrate-binding protein
MSRPRKDDFVVGLVILATVALVAMATLWVKQADVGRRRYEIAVRVRDVGGAQLGTPVVIRGVRAGRVDRLTLTDGGWVELRIVLEGDTKLPADPVVVLNEASLFGEWQATVMERSALPPDDEVRRQVAEADAGSSLVPGATLPDIAKLTTVAGRIAGDVAAVAGRVEVAFDDSAARELRSSIRNVADLSADLSTTVRAQSRNLDAATRDLRAGVGSVRDAAGSVARVAARVDSSVSTGALRHIVDDMADAATQLRSTTARLDEMSRRLDRSQLHLESVLARSDSVLAKVNGGRGSVGMLVNDSSLYRNADSLVVQLRQLVTDVRANPKRYVNVKLF